MKMDPRSQADDDRAEMLTHQRVSQLLGADIMNPFIRPEEQRHPWSVNKSQELYCPLLRIWDEMSGSQPDRNGCMLSRSPNQYLKTKEARENSLAIHLDHKDWTPTPYISFTRSADAIKELVKLRIDRKRGNQTLTVIDPVARLRNGLPILDVAAEMEHYCIPDPYKRGSKYYIDHYVCLWGVTKKEIVRHWDWSELAQTTNWYEEVIMPALLEFRGREKLDSVPTPESTFSMSMIIESLPVASKSICPDKVHFEDSDEHFEHYGLGSDDSTDTDKDSEEANQNDDKNKRTKEI